MRKSSSKLGVATFAAALAFGVFAWVGASPAVAQADQSRSVSSDKLEETYTWSAELVAFDAASNTVTVRAMLVTNPEATDLSALRAGDRAVLTWSGLSVAAGVRAVQRGNHSTFDRMTMPIEYVSSELDGRYVSFKVPVPAKDAPRIAKLSAGAYVTATSPLRATSAADAVIAIRPYSDAS